jgi:predicted membrane protein
MTDFDKDSMRDSIHRDIHERIHNEIHNGINQRIRDKLHRQQPAHGIFLGAAICIVGILLLLDHMGLVSVGSLWRFWPLFLIVAGAINLTESGKQPWGAFLILIGVLFQLDNLGIIHFRWAELWPLAIIAAGGMMIWGSLKAQRFKAGLSDAKNTMNATSVFGGVERRISVHDFKYGSVSAVFGGVELDFRDADMEGPEAVMDINVIFGGVEIRVPAHWRVEARNQTLFGGYTDSTRGPANAAAESVSGTKTLVITGQVLFGGIEVQN